MSKNSACYDKNCFCDIYAQSKIEAGGRWCIEDDKEAEVHVARPSTSVGKPSEG